MFNAIKLLGSCLLFSLWSISKTHALTVCTQNLGNFGGGTSRNVSKSKEKIYLQRDHLVKRMIDARCDVIAVQEVIGNTEDEALKVLKLLTVALAKETGKTFTSIVGKTNDRFIRNGFLVSDAVGEIGEVKSFSNYPLPKLVPLAAGHKFARGPLLIRLSWRQDPYNSLVLINFHLKSKADGWKDPTGTMFETIRMEMTEAVRQIAMEVIQNEPNTLVIVLGDRNSDTGSSSADILEGKRVLDDFRRGGSCKLSEELGSECVTPGRPPTFHSMLLMNGGRRHISYRYKKTPYLLDDILLPVKDFSKNNFTKRSGAGGIFNKGSDHKLMWFEFNPSR